MGWPDWTWKWACAGFLRWSLDPVLPPDLSPRQRWEVVLWSLWPGIKHHYLRPTEAWLHRHLPTKVLLLRLQRYGSGWYRVPSRSAAIHFWRRLGVNVLEDDFVRIERGAVTIKGFVDMQQCEFWRIEED